MDRLLGRNGAHRSPVRYHLVDDDGLSRAAVQGQSGGWHWWLLPDGKRSTPFISAEAAKAVARREAEKRGRSS